MLTAKMETISCINNHNQLDIEINTVFTRIAMDNSSQGQIGNVIGNNIIHSLILSFKEILFIAAMT